MKNAFKLVELFEYQINYPNLYDVGHEISSTCLCCFWFILSPFVLCLVFKVRSYFFIVLTLLPGELISSISFGLCMCLHFVEESLPSQNNVDSSLILLICVCR